MLNSYVVVELEKCDYTRALNLVQVLFVRMECKSEDQDIELPVVAAPHQVRRF